MDGVIGPVMALDVGERRIGIAISDPLGITATPLMTLRRTSLTADLEKIAALARERAVTRILVGYPLHMDGSVSPQAQVSERFAQALAEALGEGAPPVILWDERLSTATAEERLRELGRKAKAGIDAVAAAVILEEWLTSQRGPAQIPPPHEPEA